MTATIKRLPADVLRWMNVATHVHTAGNSACSGQQRPTEVVQAAKVLGFSALVLNEHTSDPAEPRRLSPESGVVTALRRHSRVVAELATETGYDVRFGLETNTVLVSSAWGIDDPFLPDVPSDSLDSLGSAYTVGSLHGDRLLRLAQQYKKPTRLLAAIRMLCTHPRIDALGHITRYVSDVKVDWEQVGRLAAVTGTVVELNLNLMFKELGQNRPKPDDSFDGRFHRRFLRSIARSGALVAIGLDVHNAGMWPGAPVTEGWETSLERVQAILGLVEEAGFTPGRVITSSRSLFDQVIAAPKSERPKFWS